MREKILDVLDKEIRPSLQMDGGDVEFVNYDENSGIVSVRLKGACRGCPMSTLTLQMGIEKVLKDRIPEVKSVVSV
ncbi:MAG: NifU family protein [Thermoplasmata archaeon]|nr:NifU family protein [Thermoplasmata archaeon]